MKFSSLLRLEKFYILLIVEAVFIFISSIIKPNTPTSAVITTIGLSFILLAGLNTLEENHSLKRLGLIGISFFILLLSLFHVNQHPLIYLVSFAMFFMLFLATDLSIIQNLLQSKEIKVSSIAGSLAGYLMIGISFAFFIVTLDLYQLEPLSKSMKEIGFSGILYFAFSTMTTIGYGDIVPTHRFAQIMSTMVGILSQFYIAVVVAIIIGKLMNARHRNLSERK